MKNLLFWSDILRDNKIYYDDFVEMINSRNSIPSLVESDDPLEIFASLTASLIEGTPLTLLDNSDGADPQNIPAYVEEGPYERTFRNIEAPGELVSELNDPSDEWRLTLFTSGTTGEPTRVDQTLDGITKSVRQSTKHTDDVWAFAYDPTHFAGLQVFFQAIFNLNPLVNIFDVDQNEIGDLIRSYSITHISATPTFYRTRLQQLDGNYQSVKRLTSGGEKFEPSIKEELMGIFPEAEFRNVYALTEIGSLLFSDGETFRIPDRFRNKIKVNEDNELLVHKSLSGGLKKRDSEWFNTGDIIEYADEDANEFKFVGRESDFVNVGGYRVNPHDVEEVINNVEGVVASSVSGRESSVTGNILVAKVETDTNTDRHDVETKIKDSFENLEPWKTPRSIEFVEEVDKSRTGKIIR
jgi:acyl-coenzyme A synthetase/AMP-(fatty) acid ligase